MPLREDSLYEIKARVVAAMANPTRLEILDLLADGEKTVSEIAHVLRLAQATTSQHLSVMRKAGVVATRRSGNFVFYRIADPRIGVACRAMTKAVVSLLVTLQERLLPVLAGSARLRGSGEGG